MAETQLIRCPSCGQTNRVPMDKVASGLTPVCGRCKTRMPIESKPVTVSDATFSAEVERSPLPVLVDMWAPWCGPCRMIAPMIDELASDMAGRVRFAKLNIDENPARPRAVPRAQYTDTLGAQSGPRDRSHRRSTAQGGNRETARTGGQLRTEGRGSAWNDVV